MLLKQVLNTSIQYLINVSAYIENVLITFYYASITHSH